MNDTSILLRAIDSVRPQLGELVGDDWPEFETQLDDYLEQLKTDESRAPLLHAQILALFGRYPEAHARLVTQMAQLQPGERTTRATRSVEPRSDTASPQRRVVTRYTDIACPQRVWVNTPRITVVVRLTVQRPEHSTAVKELRVLEDQPVQVHIQAPGFEILNASRQDITVVGDADSAPVVFDLSPRLQCKTHITLDFFQNGQPLRTVSLAVEITKHEVAEVESSRLPQALHMEPDVVPPDHVLHIAWDKHNATLQFTLIQNGGAYLRKFSTVSLDGDPQAHAARLYERITKLVKLEDPRDLFKHRRTIPRQDVDLQIKTLGQCLWDELIPADLKSLYGGKRDTWRDTTLLVFSDESDLPWELVWPYDDQAGEWEDAGPWCHSMRFTRWLRKDAKDNGNEMAPAHLALGAVAVLAPKYSLLSELPDAQHEREALLGLLNTHALRDVSPAEPTWGAIMAFLKEGGYDWVHFAAHGNFSQQAPNADSALWLEHDNALTPDHMTGAEITRHLRQQRPAFFFNACEVGRQGWGLTRIGGWANKLIGRGAGLFAGPLWSVTDSGALTFANAFYGSMLRGETLAVATQQARQATRQVGDPTWLAYSIYGHPNARLDIRQQTE